MSDEDQLRYRLFRKTKRSGKCLVWTGQLNNYGYGRISYKGKQRSVSRLSYELANGKIPDGLCVCHTCDEPACIKPSHLFLGTPKDNAIDRSRKNRNAVGEGNGASRLTEALVKEIREWAPYMNSRELAEELGVGKETVRAVLSGRTWRHVK